jgi:hypothetical protein
LGFDVRLLPIELPQDLQPAGCLRCGRPPGTLGREPFEVCLSAGLRFQIRFLWPVSYGLIPTLTLVANSKMGAMILFTPASEDQRHKVDSCAETTTSVGKSRLERIRHQCQCWVWAFNATPQAALPTTLWGGSLPLHIFGRLRQALRRVCPRGRAIARGRGTRPWGMREGVEGWRGLASLVGYGPEVRSWSPAPS